MRKLIAICSVLMVGFTALGCDEEHSEADEPDPAVDDGEQVVDGEEADEPDPAVDDGEQVDGGDEEATQQEASDEASVDDEAEDAALDVDFDYPGFELDAVDDENQRAQLAEVARAQLCPCPDAQVSLHDCMKRQEDERCAQADEMASTLVDAVVDGAGTDEAFDRLAQDRAEGGEVHEFDLDDAPYKGDPDADVVIVEFADFTCSHCARAAVAMEGVAERHGDDVGIFFKNYPLGSPTGEQAARAAMAAHEQGRFWEMHQRLFEHQQDLDRSRIDQFVRQLGMNYDRFTEDMNDAQLRRRIANDRDEGLEAGVRGTPAIFINGEHYTGAVSTGAISAKVQSLLDES